MNMRATTIVHMSQYIHQEQEFFLLVGGGVIPIGNETPRNPTILFLYVANRPGTAFVDPLEVALAQ